jgi:iron complex transport system permease protein
MFEQKSEKKIEKVSRLDGFSARRKMAVIGILFIILCVSVAVTVVMGTYNISIGEAYDIVLTHVFSGDVSALNKLHNVVIWNIRAPRILMAVTVGIALATAGTVYQGCFRNPLVEPYILGVSAGAAFGAGLGILYPGIFVSVQVAAFAFAALAVVFTYFLARSRGETPVITLILGGVIVGSIFSACVSIMKYMSNDSQLREITFWMMGGFYYTTWKEVFIIPIVLAAFVILWYFGWKLNVLSMGDEEAKGLGVNPEKYKLVFIALATLITAISVASVGIIAWVGLMMPHAARLILGPDNRFVIPAAALMGGIYLIFCDTIARTLTTSEIPVGIVTSIVGAPYLIYLLRSKGRAIFG